MFKYRNLDLCFWATIINVTVNCEFESYTSGYIYKVRLLNPCQSTCVGTTSYTYMIPVLTRLDTYPASGTFSVYTRYTYKDVGYGIYSNTHTMTANNITNVTMSNLGCDTVEAFCPLYIYFMTTNEFPMN